MFNVRSALTPPKILRPTTDWQLYFAGGFCMQSTLPGTSKVYMRE